MGQFTTQENLDLWLPDRQPEAVVLYLHGGGFRKGSRHEAFLPDLARDLTARGIALASASYRLHAGFEDLAEADRGAAQRMWAASKKYGLRLSPKLYGPLFLAALFDASDGVRAARAAAGGAPVVILGMSAGGILGLSLAFPPRVWAARLERPQGVLAVSAAMVQPWCLRREGPPCIMLHGSRDRIIPLEDARLAAGIAAEKRAPLEVVETGVPGHKQQMALLLDGQRPDGRAWRHLLRDLVAKSAGLPLDGPARLP